MPKRPLAEKFIQESVARQLNSKYYQRKSVYANTEEYTRLKRADVFLAFMRAPGRPYVVIVEAKSRTTIHQLQLKDHPDRARVAGNLLSLMLIVGLSVLLGYQWYFNALNTLLLLGLFSLGTYLITRWITRLELSVLGSIGAIEQLDRYPANEKWIAIGEDSIVQAIHLRRLQRQCQKKGIGLIVVARNGSMQLQEIPTPRHTFNNYLEDYRKHRDIRKKIERRPDYGRTPPERRKFVRQLSSALLLLGGVVFLGLLTYEENYGPVIPDPFEEGYLEDVVTNANEDPPPATQREGALDDEARVADCSSLIVVQRSFIVVDALLRGEKARARLQLLRQAGIPALRTAPTECLNSWPAAGRETLYLDTLYDSRPAAKAAAVRYRTMLEAQNIPVLLGKAVKVRPPKD